MGICCTIVHDLIGIFPSSPSVGVSGGGASKPKSFLEIQQEQESDFQHHPPPQPAIAMPTKTLGAKIKVGDQISLT